MYNFQNPEMQCVATESKPVCIYILLESNEVVHDVVSIPR